MIFFVFVQRKLEDFSPLYKNEIMMENEKLQTLMNVYFGKMSEKHINKHASVPAADELCENVAEIITDGASSGSSVQPYANIQHHGNS
jgi:hypothetical protein